VKRGADKVERLARDLAGLPHLDRHALKQRWKELYGIEPPSHIRRPLMVQAIAYRMQEKVLGGLKPHVRRLLSRVADDVAAGRAVVPPSSRKIKTGTRLLREWQGVTHEVIVLEDGILFRGERYGSLSEVARLITGARWSGPLFFGLKGKSRGKY
jgi:hypothetical protein